MSDMPKEIYCGYAGICSIAGNEYASYRCTEFSAEGDTAYHHDDLVKELIKAAKAATPFIGYLGGNPQELIDNIDKAIAALQESSDG